MPPLEMVCGYIFSYQLKLKTMHANLNDFAVTFLSRAANLVRPAHMFITNARASFAKVHLITLCG